MSYYSVKLKWQEPKEGTDQMRKVSKQFLVYALSVTEAEMRIVDWCPCNYQDAVVEEVKSTPYSEISIKGSTETFWSIKWLDDNDGTEAKAKPYVIILNAISAEEAIQKSKSSSSFGEIEEVKKYKGIVDEDLISEEIKKRKTEVEDTE